MRSGFVKRFAVVSGLLANTAAMAGALKFERDDDWFPNRLWAWFKRR